MCWGNKLCLVRTPKQQNFINKTLLIKQQIYMYKTAVYTLVNGGIQGKYSDITSF